MILGIGSDLVSVARLEASLDRTPTLRHRLFTETEAALPIESLAGRFAAKEALAKALGAPGGIGGLGWLEAEVARVEHGRPEIRMSGAVAARADELGVTDVHVSISHDGGFALALVVLEGRPTSVNP